MYIKLLLFPTILFMHTVFYAQNSFELAIQTKEDEEIFNVIEDKDNNFVAVGARSYNSYTEQVGIVVLINNEGDIIKEKEINVEDSLLGFYHIFQKSNGNYVCIGGLSDQKDTQNDLYISELDIDLNLIQSKKFIMGDSLHQNIEGCFINTSGNLLLYGSVHKEFHEMDMLIFEMTQDFDSIKAVIDYTDTAFSFALSVIEKKDNSGYYILANGYNSKGFVKILEVDQDFNIKTIKDIPDYLQHYGNLRWFSDSTFIITGRRAYPYSKYQDDNISCMITDTSQLTILRQKYFGAPDTSDIPARIKSVDFIDRNNIYIAGTHIFYYENGIPSAPAYDNYILIAQTDSMLNTKHETFYGGDMGYFTWAVNATSDRGCIIAASRYNYKAQTYERDGFILKLDKDASLSSSVKNIESKEQEIIIFPNPGNSKLNIRTAVQSIGGYFYMYDVSGKLVLSEKILNSFTQINTEHLKKGIYFYIYNFENITHKTGKWIKK